MKLIKSIFLLASLFLVVSCGRARKPVNNEDNNNENINNEDNNNENINDENNNDNINDEENNKENTTEENEDILSPETSELIRKLANGYAAELTIENISAGHELDHINMFFGKDICGRENYNLYKGEGGHVYRKTLDFKNTIVTENLNLTGKPNEYDYLYSNGFKLLSGYKLVDGSLEITDTSIAKSIFYNTFTMPYDEYRDNLIINKMVLKDNENQNPSLEIYYDLKAGAVITSYFCCVNYISYDYSPYILESLPTLPEHEDIGNALEQMRLLNSYTLKVDVGIVITYYVTESSILIENYYDHYKDTLVNYLYEKTNNSVTCFEIINDTLVSATLKSFTINDMKPSFDYAKEVFVKESPNFYIFNSKVIPLEVSKQLSELIPMDIEVFGVTGNIRYLRFNVENSDRFDVDFDSSPFLSYYDFNSTTIPSKYDEILEATSVQEWNGLLII